MFSLAEVSVWSVEDVILKIGEVVPTGCVFSYTLDHTCYHAIVKNDTDEVVWENSGHNPKTLFLSCLMWFHLRGKQTVNPMWKQRTSEVILHRPPVTNSVGMPPDLDPEEVESVYKPSR